VCTPRKSAKEAVSLLSLVDFLKPLPNIALTGKMRAGKDEVCKILKSFGFDIVRLSFGDFMKKHFYDTFPHIPREPKPIKLFQQYGQAMRAIYENVWVDKTMAYMEEVKRTRALAGLQPPTFVVTDVRQPNEYKAVRDAGFLVVKVEAPEEVRIRRMLALGETVSEEILNAETEQHVDTFDVDYVLHNSGSYDDLKKAVVEMVYQIQAGKVKTNGR